MPHRVRTHPPSPSFSPHTDSSSSNSSSSSSDSVSSQARTVTILGTNVGSGNLGGNQANTTGETFVDMATNPPFLPYTVCMSLPDFSQLINDPLLHNSNWPPMPTKLPSYIPKFKSNPREDLTSHARSFHMWCSSNSITEDLIHLHPFQRILIVVATKWYVD